MKWLQWQKISPLQLCWNKLLGLQEINHTVFKKFFFFDSFPDHPHALRNYALEQSSPHFTGKVTDAATAADLILSRLYFSFPCEATASVHRHWDPVRLGNLYFHKPLPHCLHCLSILEKTVVSHSGPTQEYQQVCPVCAQTVSLPLPEFWAQSCLHSCLVTT